MQRRLLFPSFPGAWGSSKALQAEQGPGSSAAPNLSFTIGAPPVSLDTRGLIGGRPANGVTRRPNPSSSPNPNPNPSPSPNPDPNPEPNPKPNPNPNPHQVTRLSSTRLSTGRGSNGKRVSSHRMPHRARTPASRLAHSRGQQRRPVELHDKPALKAYLRRANPTTLTLTLTLTPTVALSLALTLTLTTGLPATCLSQRATSTLCRR
eukprot:scaffold2790_cov56-Phaeocystis_antarctica.AAC.7